RRRSPQTQRVDALGAVAHHRPVVCDAEQAGRAVALYGNAGTLQLEGAVERYDVGAVGSLDLPGIHVAQPVVRAFHLPAVLDRLAEDAVLVAQSITDGGVLQCRQRIDEAGR